MAESTDIFKIIFKYTSHYVIAIQVQLKFHFEWNGSQTSHASLIPIDIQYESVGRMGYE